MADRQQQLPQMKRSARSASDTGGSIRQPAALCGVVGLKPTYGRVSRFGLVAFASSLDQIGPLTKTVRDAALIMNAIAGHDPQDSTSLNEPVPDYVASLGNDLRGVRLGVPKEYMIEGIDPQVRAAVDAAVKQLNSLGAEIVEVSLPQHRIRGRGLLHYCHRGSFGEPRSLRWRALRISC